MTYMDSFSTYKKHTLNRGSTKKLKQLYLIGNNYGKFKMDWSACIYSQFCIAWL